MPAFDRMCKLLLVLGLEYHIGPPGGTSEQSDLLPDQKITSVQNDIGLNPVDISGSGTVRISCSLLKEIIAMLCEEWAAMEPRAKKRMYQRFRAYFPELETDHAVTHVSWEKSD